MLRMESVEPARVVLPGAVMLHMLASGGEVVEVNPMCGEVSDVTIEEEDGTLNVGNVLSCDFKVHYDGKQVVAFSPVHGERVTLNDGCVSFCKEKVWRPTGSRAGEKIGLELNFSISESSGWYATVIWEDYYPWEDTLSATAWRAIRVSQSIRDDATIWSGSSKDERINRLNKRLARLLPEVREMAAIALPVADALAPDQEEALLGMVSGVHREFTRRFCLEFDLVGNRALSWEVSQDFSLTSRARQLLRSFFRAPELNGLIGDLQSTGVGRRLLNDHEDSGGDWEFYHQQLKSLAHTLKWYCSLLIEALQRAKKLNERFGGSQRGYPIDLKFIS